MLHTREIDETLRERNIFFLSCARARAFESAPRDMPWFLWLIMKIKSSFTVIMHIYILIVRFYLKITM